MKKTLVAALTLASISVAPAFAQTADHVTKQRAHGTAARTLNNYSAQPSYYNDPYADPYAVIVGGRVVGRDPDLNIRLQLRRDVPEDN